MKIDARGLELAIAKSCMTTRDIQKAGRLSCNTINRARHDPAYEPEPLIVGKLALALGIEVEALVKGVNE